MIIQLSGDPREVVERIGDTGGHVTNDLSIINAVAAEVPATAVAGLARHAAVRWISLDAVIQSATLDAQPADGADSAGPADDAGSPIYLPLVVANRSLAAADLPGETGGSDRADAAGLTLTASAPIAAPTTQTTELAPVSDTFVDSAQPDKSFAGCTSLMTSVSDSQANSLQRSLVRFDLTQLPPGAVVESASLEMAALSQQTSDAGKVVAQRVTSDWIEGNECDDLGIPNWYKRDHGSLWTTSGGDLSSERAVTNALSDSGGYIWDITDMAAGWVSGAYPNYGLALSRQYTKIDTNAKELTSREGYAAQRPLLKIRYRMAAVTASTLEVDTNHTPSGSRVKVQLRLTASEATGKVTPSPLKIDSAGPAKAEVVSGPAPAAATVTADATTFTWVVETTGSGRLTFSAGASNGELDRPSAENYVLVFDPIPSGDPVYTTWATEIGDIGTTDFEEAKMMVDDAGLGPDGLFGSAGSTKGSFGGFTAQATPGYRIAEVQLVLRATATAESKASDKFSIYIDGQQVGDPLVQRGLFNRVVGVDNAGLVTVDVTHLRNWSWADFERDLQVLLEIGHDRDKADVVHIDAVGFRITSRPGDDPVLFAMPPASPPGTFDPDKLENVYTAAVRATDVWQQQPTPVQGQGVTVVVVDSGLVRNRDLGKRNLANVNFNKAFHDSTDRYGHGTLMASVLGGDGTHSEGAYVGVAPAVNVINARVSDDNGISRESDVIAALQWVLQNRERYNIRAVNLSLNSTLPQSYHTSPLDAAVEILWFNRITVVVSAGNNGTADIFPPANDPFVITVGAVDDRGTAAIEDDQIPAFSAYGIDESGHTKPELVAPGRDVVAYVPHNGKLTMGMAHPKNQVGEHYFRMSGTSVSAPIVAAAAAMVLQNEPDLTPDQVKYRLMKSANRDRPGYGEQKAGAGYLDIYAAIHESSSENANTGIPVSKLLWTGSDTPNWDNVQWNSVQWNSVQWNSVQWNSVQWNSVQWNSVQWNSDFWDE